MVAVALGLHSGGKLRGGEERSVFVGSPHTTGANRTDQTGPLPRLRLSDLGTNRIESAPAPGPELAN